MSAHSPSILLGQRIKPAAEDLATSDLQMMVARVLSILRYRRWLFTLPLLAGMMLVLAVSLFLPRQYVLRTVFERRDDPVLLKLVANSPFNFEMQRQALRYSVTGQAAVTAALEQINPAPVGTSTTSDKTIKPQQIADLMDGLQVSVLNSNPNYDLIELKYTGGQPDLAEKVVPTLRDNYIRTTQASIRHVQQQAQRFFSGQVEKRRAEAARMQAELTQMVMNQPDVDPSRPEWLHQRILAEDTAIEELTRQKNETLAEIQARQEYLAQIDEQQKQGKLPSRDVSLTRSMESPERLALQAEISKVSADIADAKTVRRMKDIHPHVESLNKKLAQLQLELEQSSWKISSAASAGSPAEQSPWDSERNRIGMESKTFRGKLEQLERDLAGHQAAKSKLEGNKGTLFERQQGYTLRQQEAANVKADLEVWQSKLEEINRVLAAENVDRGIRFTTIDECYRPTKPNNPKLGSTFLLSGAVGLALAVLAVFVRELMDRSFRHPARVPQLLGIPVLETISEIVVRRSPRWWLARYAPPTVAVVQAGAVLGLGWLVYVSLEHPDAYARWLGALSASLVDLRGWLT